MSSQQMSPDPASQNRERFRSIIDDAFTNQDFTALDEIISPDIVEHQSGMGVGPLGVRGAITYLHSVFPDFTLTIEDMVTNGDTVWGRCRARGTQLGPHMGMPPTGKSIDITVIDICRFKEGKMIEHWGVPDRFAILEQLGLLPEPPAGERV